MKSSFAYFIPLSWLLAPSFYMISFYGKILYAYPRLYSNSLITQLKDNWFSFHFSTLRLINRTLQKVLFEFKYAVHVTLKCLLKRLCKKSILIANNKKPICVKFEKYYLFSFKVIQINYTYRYKTCCCLYFYFVFGTLLISLCGW